MSEFDLWKLNQMELSELSKQCNYSRGSQLDDIDKPANNSFASVGTGRSQLTYGTFTARCR